MPSILPETDRGLLTAQNCALVFIDHQPQMSFGVGSGIDRQLLMNNVLMLAKGAREFSVPTMHSWTSFGNTEAATAWASSTPTPWSTRRPPRGRT